MAERPVIGIYRDRLLPPSETFVSAQAESLQRFIPYYLGSRVVPGLPLPQERTMVVNRGDVVSKIGEASHQLLGWEPGFVRRARKLNPVLLHAHFGPDGVRALPVARALQVPLVVTFHGYDVTVKDEYARRSFYSHRVYVRRRDQLKRGGRLFVAVSEYVKGKLLEQGFPREKIVVHYIGVDPETFRPDPCVPREPVVLFVGRLVEKKGCEYLVRAMAKVQATRPEAELIVIGDGPLRPDLELLAARMLRRYRFLGTQPPNVVRAWMNRASVFSVPSLTAESGDAEAFGLVFAEAQAMELPVVSFASGGVPEAVAHGETGFLTAEREEEELARRISSLFGDAALHRRFGAAGRRRVCAHFDLHKQTAKLESIYEKVLREPTTNGASSPATWRSFPITASMLSRRRSLACGGGHPDTSTRGEER